MSTPSVSKYYNTRKRGVKHEDLKIKNLPSVSEDVDSRVEDEKVLLNPKANSITKTEKDIVNLQKKAVSSKTNSKKKTVAAKKDKTAKTIATADKKTKGNQPTLATFFTSDSGEQKTKKGPKKKNAKTGCFSCVVPQRDSSDPETTIKPSETVLLDTQSLPQSPKRNLPTPSDEGTPSKKKHLDENVASEEESCVSETAIKIKPKETARRKLHLDSLPSKSCNVAYSPAKLASSSPNKNLLRTPDKLDALIDQSRSKLLLSPRLGDLKKSLALFSEATSKIKEFQSNPCRINAVISTSKSPVKTVRPSVFASERFGNLIESERSLILPRKYKELLEMFRSMDTVVGMLNNRKEKITFGKVKDGVQKITKRNFTEKDLGQIVTILPTAYSLSIEKSSYISKKSDSPEYQLVISPNLNANEDSNKKTAFVAMNPPCLISRTNEFNRNLLELVKKHHQNFLTRIHFVAVSKDSITRWHPKFLVDSVPDVPVAPLPESPEAKTYTAKDVLNKFRGPIWNKVGKALQSVADESEKSDVTLELKQINNSKPETSKKELSGICSDLLEKIRAKESAKLLKVMTQSPAETKKLAMEERLPKIVNILWLYFIAERKAAVPIDSAVEKIIHSFNSLTTPDDVKEHLKLITEKFPGWLKFIEIPKGVYLTLDKKRNINEMLDKAGLH